MLGGESIACSGVDTLASAPGYRSRHCRRGLHLPGGESEVQWVDRLEQLAGQAPDPPCSCPPAMVLGREQLSRAAHELGLPLMLKACRRFGRRGSGIGKVVRVSTPAELAAASDRLASLPDVRVLAQQAVPGGDGSERSVAVCLDRAGVVLATFTARKIRQGNAGAGVGTYVEAHVDRQAEALAVGLLRSVGHAGVAEVELKWNSATGELLLIEINPRLWTQVTLPSVWGLNFALLAYELTLGLPIEPQEARPGRAHWQDFWDDFYWTFRRGGYRRQGAVSATGWLGQTVRANAHAHYSARDPAPAGRPAGGRGRHCVRS